MSNRLLEHIQTTGKPVSVPDSVAGVVTWHIRAGTQVDQYQLIATIDDEGLETDINATVSGKVSALMVAGETRVEAGQVLAYIATPQNAPERPTRPLGAKAGVDTREGQSVPQRGTGRDLAVSARRSTINPVVLEEIEPPAREVATRRARRREAPIRAINRTYSIGNHQERAIRKLAARLTLNDDAPGANESELVRTAIRMLLTLPDPALFEMIRANKAHEAREGFGTGRPRPKKVLPS